MDGKTQGALLVGLGVLALRLSVTGQALFFLQPGYVPLLGVAGLLVALLGLLALVRGLRAPDPAAAHDDHDHGVGGHGHDHGTAPRIAWLLALPIFAILMIAPSPLGAFAANRQARIIVPPQALGFPALPDPVAGAVELPLGEYTVRALYDPEEALTEVPVRLTGFVSSVEADRWTLTRFAIACCAADGTPIDVEVLGGPPPPAIDQWVEVVGEWTPLPDHEIGAPTREAPLIRAQELRSIPQPAEPYET